MMPKRMSVVASVMALVVGGSLAAAAPASADTGHGKPQDVWITVTGNGLRASISNTDVHPGWLKLNVKDSTSPTIGAQIVVVQMRHDYPVRRLTADIAVEVSQSSKPADGAKATRDINKIAIALGGGDALGGTKFFRSDTIWLPGRGDYYVINTGASNGRVVVVGKLEARGRTVEAGVPDHSGTVSLGNGATDTITLRGDMPAKGTIKVRNNGDGVHLLEISRVAPNATDAQVKVEYDILVGTGRPPATDPAGVFNPTAPFTGSDAVSPGHASLLSYNLPAGTYVLQCFVDDARTGMPHAFMGMHLIVHLR